MRKSMSKRELFKLVAGLRDDFRMLQNKLTLTETNHALAIQERDRARAEAENNKRFHVNLETEIARVRESKIKLQLELEDLQVNFRHLDAKYQIACRDCDQMTMEKQKPLPPIPMILMCPACDARHIDVGRFATHPHTTHACQGCGFVWRPALLNTVGVQFLPGFRDVDLPEQP